MTITAPADIRRRLGNHVGRDGFSLLEVLVSLGILVSALAGIAAMLPAAASRVGEATSLDRAGTLGILLFIATCVGIFSLQSFLLTVHGWTLGKRVLKLRVVAVDGHRAGFVQVVLLRSLIPGLAAFCCGLFSLIDALFIFGDERRCLHDLLAGTIVVNA